MKDDALKLLDGMLPYLQFQSTLAFLKNPPKGYQFPPVDIFEGIQKIRENVTKDVYPGEHAFQMDLWNLITSAHDGHLSWQGDVLSAAIVYQVGWKLVSVSEDGKALPSVYVLGKPTQLRVQRAEAGPRLPNLRCYTKLAARQDCCTAVFLLNRLRTNQIFTSIFHKSSALIL